MRRRSLTLPAALAAATLVIATACLTQLRTQVQAKVYDAPLAPASNPVAPPSPQHLADLFEGAGAPRPLERALPTVEFGLLQARVQQATDEAAAAGATLSVAVLDRATNRLVSNGNGQIPGTASVAKLFIADDLLLQEASGRTALTPDDRQAVDLMLQSSDDGAAERFWGQDGGNAIITEVAARYGLGSTTPPPDGRWWNTISSVTDLIRYYQKLLDGSGGLPAERAKMIVDDLDRSTPNGVDGYPQRFGIPDGLYAEPVAVKQGWMCCIGADWMHLSTGLVGADHRYIMVVQSLQPSDDVTARETITRAVRTMFPDGRIGPALD
ncbi:serine hydrolase [Mycobacterium sp. HUMS_1102779]|uniref:hypothetical protein n=1 Tax=Mycobacterium sp. HUMS_1102779 TaxID=3383487 RepID=UPI00389A6556